MIEAARWHFPKILQNFIQFIIVGAKGEGRNGASSSDLLTNLLLFDSRVLSFLYFCIWLALRLLVVWSRSKMNLWWAVRASISCFPMFNLFPYLPFCGYTLLFNLPSHKISLKSRASNTGKDGGMASCPRHSVFGLVLLKDAMSMPAYRRQFMKKLYFFFLLHLPTPLSFLSPGHGWRVNCTII